MNGQDDRIQLGSSNTVGALYASFTLDMTSLPTGNGNYFATFCDAGTQNFKGRVFVTTAGAAVGSYRVGIINATGNTIHGMTLAQDLSLSNTYTIVERLTLGGLS